MTNRATPGTNSLLDAFDELFFVFDASGNLLDWNRTTVEVTGYDPTELAEMTPADFFEDAAADRIAAAATEVLASGEATVEADLVTADGEVIPYEFRVHRLPDEEYGTEAVAGIARDLTERRRAERERREILDRTGDGFFALDADWRVTYANDAGEAMLDEAMTSDLDDVEVEGLHLWEEIPEAVETTFYERYHEAMRTQEPVTFEEYYEPLEVWFEVRAYPSETGLSVYFRDVTERRSRREALERRESVLRGMYGIVADRDRSFEAQVEALLELGRRELDTDYGTLSAIRGEEYVFEVVDAADDAVRAGDVVPLSATNCERTASTERTLVLGDIERDAPEQTDRAGYTDWGISCYIGAPVFVEEEVYGTFCFYDTEPRDGQFSEWEVTLVDLMSRWVSQEMERRAAQDRLREQNRTLERFSSAVSHDLRNLLEVLEGSVVMTQETGDVDRLADAHRAIDRMEALVEDLLLLARSGTAVDETVTVDLGSVAEASWSTVGTEAATLRVETDRTVLADRSRLRQLLDNLFVNALDHAGEDVTVTVGDLPGGFWVADDGPGIDAADRERVFESGFSTDDEGAGLGLAIVAEIAEAHGWTVEVTDGAAGGARFEFTGVDGPPGAAGDGDDPA